MTIDHRAIAEAIAGIWYGTTKTVSGVKKMNHAIASKFHHQAATPQKAKIK
jgi:hypothetical protein